MNKNKYRVAKLFSIAILLNLLQFNTFASAQSQQSSCPNFEFTRNMQKGTNSQDVLVLQKILNLDSRTQISKSGVGSKGQETKIFGDKTREALKRFQALFIEYTTVADGKFNNQTRQLVNDICQGPFFTGQSTDVFSTNDSLGIDPNDKTGPTITISGPDTIYKDEVIRVNILGNENLRQPGLTSLILDGASANDIRKLSPNSYSVGVRTNDDNNTGQINIQIEANTISDVNGNKNENASNELIIEVLVPLNSASTSTSTINTSTTSEFTDISILNDILKTLPTAPPAKDCVNSGSVSVYDYSNPCYGRAQSINPNISAYNPESNRSKGQTIISPMLQGLVLVTTLSKLTGGFAGLSKSFLDTFGLSGSSANILDGGGYGSIPGKCMCKSSPYFGQPTIGLYKFGGIPYGRYIMAANPNPVGGPFVGKFIEKPGIICGKLPEVKGVCEFPNLDSSGAQQVLGILPPPPVFSWSTPTVSPTRANLPATAPVAVPASTVTLPAPGTMSI